MSQDDKIHNPVEQYMQYIMDQDKPDKPPETTAEPTGHLEVKGNNGNRDEALKVADALKQSMNIRSSLEYDFQKVEESAQTTTFNMQRHPMGLILILTLAVVVYAIVFSLISFFLPTLASAMGTELNVIGPIAGVIMLVLVAVGIISSLAVSRAYRLNRLILTESSLIHALNSGLANNKIYEIPLADIENVSVQNTDILSSAFSYGTINIKTIEGQNNVKFRYAPSPDVYAKAIQDSRLEYLTDHRLSFL